MKTLPSLLALLLFAGLAVAGPVPATPAWKLKEGDVFYVRQTRKTEQKLHAQDSVIRQEVKAESVSQFKVISHADGALVLQQKIEAINLSGENDKPGVKDILKALTGATFTFHLDKDSHITKVDGYEALVKKLVKGDDGLAVTVRTLLPESEFRAAVEHLFDFLPHKPVEKETTWGSEATEPLGAFGLLKVASKWSLANGAVEPDVARIAGTQKVVLDTATADKTLPFRVKAGIVKKASAKVDVFFNVTKGRLQKRTLDRRLDVQLLVEKDKRTLDLLLEQHSQITLEVLEKNPIKK